jgi:predicted nucleotidyltransferase component of viral defense system
VTKPVKDIAASVRQRLQNLAKKTGRPFQEVLEYYAMERFLYRVSRSPHAHRFVLKGALIFRTWGGPATRPTRDIDLLAKMENTPEAATKVFREICESDVEPDGMKFDAATVIGVVIKEEADYSGVRVSFLATLQNARVAMQVDLGFADVMTPGPVTMHYPVLLEFPAPRLAGYTRETVIAEKFEAMVKLGELNSRMKDFYDVNSLARRFEFSGSLLATAIARTFENRNTILVRKPLALTPAFAELAGKEAQWKGFVKKAKLDDVIEDFSTVIDENIAFLFPVVEALVNGDEFQRNWKPSGRWE